MINHEITIRYLWLAAGAVFLIADVYWVIKTMRASDETRDDVRDLRSTVLHLHSKIERLESTLLEKVRNSIRESECDLRRETQEAMNAFREEQGKAVEVVRSQVAEVQSNQGSAWNSIEAALAARAKRFADDLEKTKTDPTKTQSLEKVVSDHLSGLLAEKVSNPDSLRNLAALAKKLLRKF